MKDENIIVWYFNHDTNAEDSYVFQTDDLNGFGLYDETRGTPNEVTKVSIFGTVYGEDRLTDADKVMYDLECELLRKCGYLDRKE